MSTSRAEDIDGDLTLCGPCRVGNCAGHGRFFVNGQLEPCAHDHPLPDCHRRWDTAEAHATWHHRCNLPVGHDGTHQCGVCAKESPARRSGPMGRLGSSGYVKTGLS